MNKQGPPSTGKPMGSARPAFPALAGPRSSGLSSWAYPSEVPGLASKEEVARSSASWGLGGAAAQGNGQLLGGKMDVGSIGCSCWVEMVLRRLRASFVPTTVGGKAGGRCGLHWFLDTGCMLCSKDNGEGKLGLRKPVPKS